MMSLDGSAALGVNAQGDGITGLDGGVSGHRVRAGGADLLHGADFIPVTIFCQEASIAHLTTHLGVERGFIGDDEERIVLRMDFEHESLAVIIVKADKFSGGVGGYVERSDDVVLLSFTGLLALLFHALLKDLHVHFQSTLGAHQFGEVDRETKGVVELEGHFAAEGIVLHIGKCVFEALEAPVQCLIEAGFLALEGYADGGFTAFQFREDLAHLLD